jgi:hypothetical protein
MAGVFMISLGTIWVRTRLMPRWLAFFTYALALGLLLTISSSPMGDIDLSCMGRRGQWIHPGDELAQSVFLASVRGCTFLPSIGRMAYWTKVQ